MELEDILRQRIPDDIVQMENMIRDIDQFRYQALRDKNEAENILTEAKNRHQLPKTSMSKVTEADRKMHVEFRTKDEQENADNAIDIFKYSGDKINNIQSLIKAETEMLKRS